MAFVGSAEAGSKPQVTLIVAGRSHRDPLPERALRHLILALKALGIPVVVGDECENDRNLEESIRVKKIIIDQVDDILKCAPSIDEVMQKDLSIKRCLVGYKASVRSYLTEMRDGGYLQITDQGIWGLTENIINYSGHVGSFEFKKMLREAHIPYFGMEPENKIRNEEIKLTHGPAKDFWSIEEKRNQFMAAEIRKAMNANGLVKSGGVVVCFGGYMHAARLAALCARDLPEITSCIALECGSLYSKDTYNGLKQELLKAREKDKEIYPYDKVRITELPLVSDKSPLTAFISEFIAILKPFREARQFEMVKATISEVGEARFSQEIGTEKAIVCLPTGEPRKYFLAFPKALHEWVYALINPKPAAVQAMGATPSQAGLFKPQDAAAQAGPPAAAVPAAAAPATAAPATETHGL